MTSPTATAEIERLAREATKGEWLQDQGVVFVDNRAQVCCGQGIEECCGRPDVIGNADMIAQSSPADAAYIAAASPDVVLGLLKELAKAKRERDEWRDRARTAEAMLTTSA